MKGKRAFMVVACVLAMLFVCLAVPGTAFAKPWHALAVEQSGWGDVGVVCTLAALVVIPCAAALIAGLARHRH